MEIIGYKTSWNNDEGTYEDEPEIAVELLLFLNLRILRIDDDFFSCDDDVEVDEGSFAVESTSVVRELPVSSWNVPSYIWTSRIPSFWRLRIGSR